jgi:hypothetical protein
LDRKIIKLILAGCRWLTPVIPATQKAEIRRIAVEAQANSSRDSILKTPFTEKGWRSGSRCRPLVQAPVLQKKKKPKKQQQKKLVS